MHTCILSSLDRVNNVIASIAQLPGSAYITWDFVSLPSASLASQYQVVYRPISSTIVQFKNVSLEESTTILTELQDLMTYEVYVRLVCSDGGGVGELSDAVQLALVDASMFHVQCFIAPEGYCYCVVI